MLTYDVIRKLAMEEKSASKLNTLPEGFFDNVKGYLDKKGKMSQSKEDKWEYDAARRWLQDLLDIRERKILMLASSYLRSGGLPGDMTAEEKRFFESVVEQLKAYHENNREILEGKKEKLLAVAFLKDVPRFVGLNMKNYGPFRKGDIASILEENALLLIEKGAAKKLTI